MDRMRWGIGVLCLVACGPGGGSSHDDDATTGAADSTSTNDPTIATSTSGPPATTSGTTDVDSSGGSTEGSGSSTGAPTECVSPWEGASIIACADGTGTRAIAVDGDTIYFAHDGSLWTLDTLVDAEPTMLVDGGLGGTRELILTDDVVYWVVESGTVGSYDPATDLATTFDGFGQASGIAVIGTDVFVTDYAPAGSLQRLSLADRSVTPVYTDLEFASDLLAESGDLVFVTNNDNGNLATPIVRGTVAGDPLATVQSGLGSIERMRLRGTDLYLARYRVGASTIERLPADGSTPPQVLGSTDRQPFSLGVGDDRVYFVDAFVGAGNEGGLRSVAIDGGDPIDHILADGFFYDVGVTDSGVVVFGGDLGIGRLD